MSKFTYESLTDSPHSNRIIFRGIWGSHAHGASTPESSFLMSQIKKASGRNKRKQPESAKETR